jgi:hypothetical protein
MSFSTNSTAFSAASRFSPSTVVVGIIIPSQT